MPIKVSSTAPGAEGDSAQQGSDASEALLSDFTSGLPPETRAALRAALLAQQKAGASVELDPALDGRIELDPALAGPIEPDPVLGDDFDLDPSLDAAERAARAAGRGDTGAPRGVAPAAPGPSKSEKNGADPTLRAPRPLVVSGASPEEVDNRPPQRVDEAVQTAAPEASAAARSPIEEPMIEERDAHEDARPVTVAEEAEMPQTTTEPPTGEAPAEAGPDPSAAPAGDIEPPETASAGPPSDAEAEAAPPEPDEPEVAADASAAADAPQEPAAPVEGDAPGADPDAPPAEQDEVAAEAAPEPEVSAAEVAPDPEVPAADAAPDPEGLTGADDLFEAVPDSARHFMALLEREGTLLMPQVMAHLGLVRPKGVGGAIEPIQRIARLIGVELPFVADFAPSGYKRWTWKARPLAEVPPETLEPIPEPPPQPKKVKRSKRKADRSQYKRAWKRSLAKKKGRRGKGGKGPAKGRRAGPPRAAPAAARLPAGHRDESGNAGREPRRGPTPEGRRRRYDRPMPEVFRRANRPPVGRPAPARREEHRGPREDVEPRRPRLEERPAAARSGVPRLERSSDPAGPAKRSASESEALPQRRGVQTPEERLPLPRSGVFRRRTVGDSDVPVVVIRRRKR